MSGRVKCNQEWKTDEFLGTREVFFPNSIFAQKFKLKIELPLSCWIAGFFNHQYLQKELIDLLGFFHGNNHQRNNELEINTYNWVWPVLLSQIKISRSFQEVSLDDMRFGVRLNSHITKMVLIK